MNRQIAPAPVRKTIHVAALPARAFEVFTASMGRWWRPEHHIAPKPFAEIIVEPRPGGRWFERDREGAECEWGNVLVWEPPDRVVFAWQLNQDWKYDPDFVTELEIQFVADDGGTRVELEHRNIDRFGDKAAQVRASLDSIDGWNGALAKYAELANRG